MKTRYKIILISSLSVLFVVVSIIMGPVIFMIGVNAYSGFIMSSIPDSVFEEEFAKTPEVRLFMEKYPNYSTSHYGDFLGWKIIRYAALVDDDKSIHLEVKKSTLHQGVRISAGCDKGDHSYELDIPQEQVINYVKENRCLGE